MSLKAQESEMNEYQEMVQQKLEHDIKRATSKREAKEHEETLVSDPVSVFNNSRTFVDIEWLVDWLCFASHRQQGHLETASPFTVLFEGCEARFLHCFHQESNPGPSRGSPLHYRCATPALFDIENEETLVRYRICVVEIKLLLLFGTLILQLGN